MKEGNFLEYKNVFFLFVIVCVINWLIIVDLLDVGLLVKIVRVLYLNLFSILFSLLKFVFMDLCMFFLCFIFDVLM